MHKYVNLPIEKQGVNLLMAAKKQNQINLKCYGEEDGKRKLAELCLNTDVDAALIVDDTKKDFKADFQALIDAVKREADRVASGDMTAMESMLVSQAYALQGVFTRMMHKTANAEYMHQIQTFSKIALKAQNQCRQTLAALSEMKNPKRTTFIKNQATNQQVNFNENSEKNKNQSNELLSEGNDAPMDITGTATPSTANKELATVEK